MPHEPSSPEGASAANVEPGSAPAPLSATGRAGRPARRLPDALRQRDYALFLVAVVARALPGQMIAVAVGWQVYAIHRHPFDLGLVGLAEFLPLLLIALPAGQLADRTSRRLVFAVSVALSIVVAALLIPVTMSGARDLWPFLALGAVSGAAIGFGNAASRALPPELVSKELLPSAFALRSIATQGAVVVGPVLGGVLFAVQPESVYEVALFLLLVSLGCALALHRRGGWRPSEQAAPGWAHLLGGISFLRRSPVVSGLILLDLFAVLFGGAVALLPVFAQAILHTGPTGLGLLRSAPAVGAIAAGVLIARLPATRRAGPLLLVTIALFGLSMIVFGLSRWLLLSVIALAVSGAADMVSVNIRGTAVALATPNDLRGRVNAVETVFIGASNQLGAFESGAAAALFGTVPAVVAGGVITIAIAAAWTRLFPALAALGRLR